MSSWLVTVWIRSCRCLPRHWEATYYGVNTGLHWRRNKALIDNDGVWLDMNVPKDVSAPIIDSVDHFWCTDRLAVYFESAGSCLSDDDAVVVELLHSIAAWRACNIPVASFVTLPVSGNPSWGQRGRCCRART